MKLQLLILAGVALLSGLLMLADYRHGKPAPAEAVSRPEAQAKAASAPDFIIRPMLGKTQETSLAALKGRYVLLNAWASWCPPCVEEFPDLLALAKDHPQRLTLLTLSADRNEEAAREFLAQFDAPASNVLHVFDARQRIAREQFFIERYPESILIDPQGQMIRKFAGMLSKDDLAEIRMLLNAAE